MCEQCTTHILHRRLNLRHQPSDALNERRSSSVPSTLTFNINLICLWTWSRDNGTPAVIWGPIHSNNSFSVFGKLAFLELDLVLSMSVISLHSFLYFDLHCFNWSLVILYLAQIKLFDCSFTHSVLFCCNSFRISNIYLHTHLLKRCLWFHCRRRPKPTDFVLSSGIGLWATQSNITKVTLWFLCFSSK